MPIDPALLHGHDPFGRFARPSRRLFLAGVGSLTASVMLPRLASAAGARDPRLVVIVLRGALDGLGAVPPVGDPHYAALRPDIAVEAAGENAVLPLDGFFGLNPGLTRLHAMVARGEALIVHAAATPYRQRSHFQGQDVLENGSPRPDLATGWLNRLAGILPAGGQQIGATPVRGLGIGATVPLILRGPAPTVTWTPTDGDTARADTIERLAALYSARDPALEAALVAGVDLDQLAAKTMAGGMTVDATLDRAQRTFVQLANATAGLIAADDGPRIAAISYDGWDIHANSGGGSGRLARLLAGLDVALDGLRTGLGPVWNETAVLVITEFGRTARENGTDGTDHGTGTTAFLLGGRVKGGRIIADWPGLAEADLFENRDLKPTLDLRALCKGVITELFDVPERLLSEVVFPESAGVRPMRGLLT